MSSWDDLVAYVVLGSGRQPLPTLRLQGRVGAALDAVQTDPKRSNQQKVLAAAAILSLHARAGRLPDKAGALPAVSDCPQDDPDWTGCSPEAAGLLAVMLSSKTHECLLWQWLSSAVSSKKLVPPMLIPRLLDAALKSDELNELILAATGARGRYLLSLNAQWAALGDSANMPLSKEEFELLWQTGKASQRITLLQKLRSTDPCMARTLVESTWKEDNYKERAAFVEQFIVGLSEADEPFLEEVALNDGRKEVRTVVHALLAKLPRSRYTARMIDRVAPLLRVSGSEIIVELPKALDERAGKDGIESSSGDQRAGWRQNQIQQMLSVVHPSFWCEKFGLTPLQIVDLVRVSKQWRKLLVASWCEAARLHCDQEWIEALLTVPESPLCNDLAGSVYAFDAEFRQRLAGKILSGHLRLTVADGLNLLVSLIPSIPMPWSAEFSILLLNKLKSLMSQSTDWRIGELVEVTGQRACISIFGELDGRWDTRAIGWSSCARFVDRAIAFMRERTEIDRCFRQVDSAQECKTGEHK